MNKRDVKKFEKLLVEEHSRLSHGIRHLEQSTLYESGGNGGRDLQSYAETGTDNFDRETALNIASGESERLRDVSDALRRIEEGGFGTCEGCEKEIPKKRLEVFPAARYCIECQSKLEKYGVL